MAYCWLYSRKTSPSTAIPTTKMPTNRTIQPLPAVIATLGIVVLLAAAKCGVVDLTSDGNSEDRQNSRVRPVRAASIPGEERRSMKRRERVSDPEADFLRHLSKIGPITDFETPSDGYFEAYLLTRSAENLLNQHQQANQKEAILELFEKSYAYFLGVQETAPDWKNQMVLMRLEKTKNSLREAYFASNK